MTLLLVNGELKMSVSSPISLCHLKTHPSYTQDKVGHMKDKNQVSIDLVLIKLGSMVVFQPQQQLQSFPSIMSKIRIILL